MKCYKVARAFSSYGIWYPTGEVIKDASFVDNIQVRINNAQLISFDRDKEKEPEIPQLKGPDKPQNPTPANGTPAQAASAKQTAAPEKSAKASVPGGVRSTRAKVAQSGAQKIIKK